MFVLKYIKQIFILILFVSYATAGSNYESEKKACGALEGGDVYCSEPGECCSKGVGPGGISYCGNTPSFCLDCQKQFSGPGSCI